MPGVELSMEALGALADGAAAEAALQPIVAQYRTWIEARRSDIAALQGTRRETAEELLRLAGVASDRIERGIATLVQDADALDAFRVASRAVARALRQRLTEQFKDEPPRWRAFQLAFILLNLPGLADPHDTNRETVDLLFFPTGGGKTEAYFGLAAFAMVLRRLRHPGDKGLVGAGVSVIMRYTLRLLTLDQLARAAGLVCALELEREKEVARYGEWPFEIGLWVGKAATPNILGRRGDGRSDSARAKVRQFKADPKGKPSPIPLENCPWCGTRFGPDSFALLPNDDQPRELHIVCTNFECDFTRDRTLPIVAVDEPIYRRLPAFLIATVDKFAALPWVGQAGALLGGAERHDTTGFYGAAEPGKGTRLKAPLSPPDLVIQDEL
ncbi:MAG: helicase, partial [Planctomycetota bacterium]